jgi:molybdopterin-guanine dinucleotide biosynthesis protein A
MSHKISGVILAGGEGKRFSGKIKAKEEIDGKAIISRILSVISSKFDEIIIVTNTPEEFAEQSDCLIVRDVISDSGPLGGIHAAMKSCSGEAIFVFAGDMPFLDANIIQMLIDTFSSNSHDAVIPKTGGLIEPLHSIYSVSIAGKLEEWLINDKSKAVREFIGEINVKYLQIEDSDLTRKAFTNINSQSDVDLFTNDNNL